MKKVKYNDYLTEAFDSLPEGAFLTVEAEGERNTMTIGWATVGIVWGKPIMQVLVRTSRHTHDLIEKTDEFTVSFCFDDSMQEALNFCGSKSGRDYDKFKECGLKTIPGQTINTPVIEGCNLHYECKVKYKQHMDKKNLVKNIQNSAYANGDYHTMYFGEIVDCYLEK